MKNQLPPKPKRWLYHPWQQGSSTCDKRQWVFHIDVEELWPTIFGRIVFIQAHSRVLSHRIFPQKSCVSSKCVLPCVHFGQLWNSPSDIFSQCASHCWIKNTNLNWDKWGLEILFWILTPYPGGHDPMCYWNHSIESLKVRHSFLHFCG